MSMANLMGGIIFGAIGLAAFVYGKKQANFKPMAIGIALIAFPYFISNTMAIYAIGAALSVALFIFCD